jgi:hypothetical protein
MPVGICKDCNRSKSLKYKKHTICERCYFISHGIIDKHNPFKGFMRMGLRLKLSKSDRKKFADVGDEPLHLPYGIL